MAEMRTPKDQGSVSVHVLDGQGEPFAGPVHVFANGQGWMSQCAADGGSSLVLRHIPFGEPFGVYVDAGAHWNGAKQDCEAILLGEAGRSITVTIDRPAPVFVGRVRGANGMPLGRLAVRLEMHREGRNPFLMFGELDLNHRFRFVPKGPLGDRVTVWARVEGYWVDQVGEVLIPVADSQGVHDFGDVKLALAPVELGGRVCFPDGSPASGVQLEWAYEWERTQEESDEATRRRADLKPLSRCEPGRLKSLGYKPHGRCTTAVDGTFLALGPESNRKAYFGTQWAHVCEAGTFLLPRDASGFYTEEGTELTLIQAAGLKGTIEMEGNRRADVFVDYPDGFRVLVCTVTGPNPEFGHSALHPGVVELTVVDTADGKVLASLRTLSLIASVGTVVRLSTMPDQV